MPSEANGEGGRSEQSSFHVLTLYLALDMARLYLFHKFGGLQMLQLNYVIRRGKDCKTYDSQVFL